MASIRKCLERGFQFRSEGCRRRLHTFSHGESSPSPPHLQVVASRSASTLGASSSNSLEPTQSQTCFASSSSTRTAPLSEFGMAAAD